MTRIYKFVRSETGDATPFGREFLEEFPEQLAIAPDFGPPVGEDPEDAEEAPVDLEALRNEILEATRAEAEQKVQEAYQEGLARGHKAGQEKFEATLAQCAETLTTAAEVLQESQQTFLNNLEPQVITLVKMIVTRVIDAELQSNPDLPLHMARRALEKLAGQFAVTLHVHPDDLEAIRQHEVTLLDRVHGVETLHIHASEGVEPGGCIAQSESMEVDARLESLLAQALDALTK